MRIKMRLEKEKVVIPLMIDGLHRRIAEQWFDMVQADRDLHEHEYAPGFLRYWHKQGYLSSSIERWGLTQKKTDLISDREYLCTYPINNSFQKWLIDRLTTRRILYESGNHFQTIYFSIIQREGKQLILSCENENRCYTIDDVFELISKKGVVELLPARWNSKSERYIISLEGEDISKKCCCYSNVRLTDKDSLARIIDRLDCSYVISDVIKEQYTFNNEIESHILDLWICNELDNTPVILSAEIHLCTNETGWEKRKRCTSALDLQHGTFNYNNKLYNIPNWKGIKEAICLDAAHIPQVFFFSVAITVGNNGGFTYLSFSVNPSLPLNAFGKECNDYLKSKYEKNFIRRTLSGHIVALSNHVCSEIKAKFSRKGMRPYMYDLWLHSAWNDLLHTKGVSLPRKIWAHRHGFFSWRLYQYGLTKDNYQNFLSDYDYYWLNRINNEYQIWVNDKTTFRYIMEPYKEYVPRYYFSAYKQDETTQLKKMQDCPDDVPEGIEGLKEMLRRQKKLAFKPSAGTHGDGFYCLSYEDGEIVANGVSCGEDGLCRLVDGTKSFYVVTEYLEMHRELKKIYDKSVNTVRMMVVNEHGYDPRILQTYMRIGSSRTGYTDNVGYGGICVFVDKETGKLYQPETIRDHVFYDCPIHPDTGVCIDGYLPHWKLIREKILDICLYLCELEYLGFDIAITDEGFKILEINIHQDLHKVATFDDEIKEFFTKKIQSKYEYQKTIPISNEEKRQ